MNQVFNLDPNDKFVCSAVNSMAPIELTSPCLGLRTMSILRSLISKRRENSSMKHLVFDSCQELAYVPYAPAEGQFAIGRYDLLASTSALLPVAGFAISYAPAYMGAMLVEPTRLWFSGGSSCSGSSINFCPVRDTFFVRLVANP
jgi:hypothetical protein